MIIDVSMNMYTCQIHEEFPNSVKNEIVDDCIDNYMFLADQNSYDIIMFYHHPFVIIILKNKW